MKIQINNRDHWKKVVAFAQESHLSSELSHTLSKLFKLARGYDEHHSNVVLNIGYDFAPNSFFFTITYDGGQGLHGGVIFYRDSWGIHT